MSLSYKKLYREKQFHLEQCIKTTEEQLHQQK